MTSFIPAGSAWPPFPVEQLPRELHGLMEDFRWAATQPHPPLATSPLITVVVPCFDPDPHQFAQLLLSLLQQSDQSFDLLLVNDGSSETAWCSIQAQLAPYSWIQVLDQPTNLGISAALNAAMERVTTPYVALVDQDDILHPGALALVNRHLKAHPDCGLLYTDHLIFDAAGTSCQVVNKFPWNPEALLEFNFLIHLTVVKTELYRACGGMTSRFDGIQDWEFYLRLTPCLAGHSVVYLPVPLYAWRLSDRSIASSARPKRQLLELAHVFLAEAHARWGAASGPALPDGSPSHYRFGVDRCLTNPRVVPQLCNLLVLAPHGTTPAMIRASLQSAVEAGLPMERVFVALDAALPQALPGPWPEPQFLSGSLAHLPDHLAPDAPLLVLQAGVRLRACHGWSALTAWLEHTPHWDLLTFPGFDPVTGVCVSAGYSSPVASSSVYFPHATGLTAEAYAANFASFGHTRAVDLPSPAVQMLASRCVAPTLEALGGSASANQATVPATWWTQLALLSMRCACLVELSVEVPSNLAGAERSRVAVRHPAGIELVRVLTWLASAEGETWSLSYGQLLARVLAQGAGRAHLLYFCAFLAQAQHPAVRHAAEQRAPRFSLLPPVRHKPLVLLIPTELNARSNGHACLLTLAVQLQAAGQLVFLLPFKPYAFFKHYLSRLPKRYRYLPFISDPREVPGAVLIAPESSPSHIVQRLRDHYSIVLWWLLAPAGFLTPFRPDIRLGDRLVAFSEFILPNQLHYLFVHPPATRQFKKLMAQHTPQPPRKPLVTIYTGKGRLRALPRRLHRHILTCEVMLITRTYPATKKDLVRLLTRSSGLISFDPMTNLTLEAASLGVPTFLPANPFHPNCYRNFPADLSPFITDSIDLFLARIKDSGPRRKLSLGPLYRATNQSMTIVSLLTADPEPIGAQCFRVTDEVLQRLRDYRRQLVGSYAIQIDRDGQSISSAFIALYLRSLRAPYGFHVALSHALTWLDRAGDLAVALQIFRMLRPLFRLIARPVHALERRWL